MRAAIFAPPATCRSSASAISDSRRTERRLRNWVSVIEPLAFSAQHFLRVTTLTNTFSIRGDGQSSPCWRMVPNLESFEFAGGFAGQGGALVFRKQFSHP